MLRRLAAALPLLAVVALLGACTLLVDTGSLSDGNAADAAGNEGGPPRDAMTTGAEASVDAAGDAAASSPCAMPHAFCDDFDTGPTDVSMRWDVFKTTAGPLLLDTSHSRSAPRSLRMHLTPTTGNQDSELSKNVPVTNGSGRVELDMFVPTPVGPWTEVDPIGVALTPTPAGYNFHGLYLVVRSDGSFLQYFAQKKGANLDNRAPMTVRNDVWHHVVFTFSYATMPPKGTIAIDSDVGSVDMGAPVPTALQLELGASYTENTNLDWSLYFDNAVIDTP